MDAAADLIKGDIEKDDGGDLSQMSHGPFAIHRTAAGGDHLMVDIEAQNLLLLNPAQTEIAALLKDLLQRLLAIDLNQDIGINKTQTHGFGEDNADSAFTCARHTDQGDVGFHRLLPV